MNFLEALQLLKKSCRIRRQNWTSCWYMCDRKVWVEHINGDKYCLSDSDSIDFMKLLEDCSSDDWQFFDKDAEEFRCHIPTPIHAKTVTVVDAKAVCKRCGEPMNHKGSLCCFCWDEVTRK